MFLPKENHVLLETAAFSTLFLWQWN